MSSVFLKVSDSPAQSITVRETYPYRIDKPPSHSSACRVSEQTSGVRQCPAIDPASWIGVSREQAATPAVGSLLPVLARVATVVATCGGVRGRPNLQSFPPYFRATVFSLLCRLFLLRPFAFSVFLVEVLKFGKA